MEAGACLWGWIQGEAGTWRPERSQVSDSGAEIIFGLLRGKCRHPPTLNHNLANYQHWKGPMVHYRKRKVIINSKSNVPRGFLSIDGFVWFLLWGIFIWRLVSRWPICKTWLAWSPEVFTVQLWIGRSNHEKINSADPREGAVWTWGCGSDGRLGHPEAEGHRYLYRWQNF